jgi:hypothetical protein
MIRFYFFFLVSLLFVNSSVAVPIDDFSIAQSIEAVASPGGNSESSTVTGNTVLGGSRSIIIEAFSSIPRELRVVVSDTIGELSHSQAAQVNGITELVWDGDNENGVNTGGLGGLDFTSDNADAFLLSIISFDYSGFPVDITIKVYPQGGLRAAEAKLVLNERISAGPTTRSIPFSSFVTQDGNVSDILKNAGAITLQIDGSKAPDVDLVIDKFSTNGLCSQYYPTKKDFIDECGVCGGDNSTCADCLGVPKGLAKFDECGICNGNNSTCADCLGKPNGTSKIDSCGVCDGDNSSCKDCNGVPNGGVKVDQCGVCGGDNSSCNDCKGTPNGNAKAGSACNITVLGKCTTGTYSATCTCVPSAKSPEICDGVDNDCNGKVDDKNSCGVSATCESKKEVFPSLDNIGNREHRLIIELITTELRPRIDLDSNAGANELKISRKLKRQIRTIISKLPKNTYNNCGCSEVSFVQDYSVISENLAKWKKLARQIVDQIKNLPGKDEGASCTRTPQECLAGKRDAILPLRRRIATMDQYTKESITKLRVAPTTAGVCE